MSRRLLDYLLNPKLGSRLYNLAHTDIFPAALGALVIRPAPDASASIRPHWLSYIEIDRALGLGLKYPTFFKDTHLQRV